MAEVPSIRIVDAAGNQVDVATLTALIAIVGDLSASPAANTLLDRVKALKTSIDAGNVLLTTQAGFLDGVEGLLGNINTALAGLAGFTDGLEALIGTTNANQVTAMSRGVAQLGSRLVSESPAVNIATNQPAIPVDQKTAASDIAISITRPADVLPYAAGDVVGGPRAFAAVGPAGAAVMITGIQLEYDVSIIPTGAANWRMYFYSGTPPSALADNAAFDLSANDRATFLGFVDIGLLTDLGSTLYVEANNLGKQVKLTGTDLFAYLVTMGPFTPGSADVFQVKLHAVTV